MMTRNRLLFALFTLTLVTALACTPETVRLSPTPSAIPSASASNSPGSTPSQACAPLTGGSPLGASRLATIRAAHNPGFDRLVFEFSGPVVPEYRIELASSFTAPSGQQVRVDGNAFFKVRFVGQAHNDAGQKSYPQADPYRVGLSVVREIKLVEDFEGVVVFGLGMERPVCPTVLTLLGPTRVVVDFPTPP
jgi:hypothetical protein